MTCVYAPGSRCPEELNKMITFAQQWAEDNGAKINYGKEKSEVIVFNETPEQKKERGNTVWATQARYPHRHAKVVQEVTSFRYLGFTLAANIDMDIQCTQIIKKIKLATGKVLRYTRALKKSTQMDYQLQITLTIWRAIVLVHITTNTILLKTDEQIQRIQNDLDNSFAECMGMKREPTLQNALNTDCGVLPVKQLQAIDLATLHARLLAVDTDRPAAQIHKHLIRQPLIYTNCLKENMRLAHITLGATHLWGKTPEQTDPPPTKPNKQPSENSYESKKKTTHIQNKKIPDPQQHNHTTPYVGPPCLRCNPGAASTQGRLILPTHLPTDTYHRIVNDCVSLQEERTTLG